MPQDIAEEQKAQMPFTDQIGVKVNELRLLLEAQKSAMVPKIATLQKQKLQFQEAFDLMNEASADQYYESTSTSIIPKIDATIRELEMRDMLGREITEEASYKIVAQLQAVILRNQ